MLNEGAAMIPGCETRRMALVLTLCAAAVACASGEDGSGEGRRGGEGDTPPGDGDGDGETPVDPEPGGTPGFDNAGPDDDGPDASVGTRGDAALPPPDCAGSVQEAREVVVDMYVMLDKSGSMLAPSGSGATKWDDVVDALSAFVNDPRSDGLGVGLQYFPLGREGVPPMCTQDSECGPDGGACLTRACRPTVTDIPFTLCIDDRDCPLTTSCEQHGRCSDDQSYACFDISAGGCGDLGDCLPVVSECLYYATCDVAEYARPAVPIGTLPDNAMALIGSLDATMPVGLTPTSAAVEGALSLAQQQAMAEPTHKVIAVLATDGTPTECAPVEPVLISGLIAAGLSAGPGIETYVIGVFGAEDAEGLVNADSWANAGGTGQAFIIDPQQDVAMQFLDALQSIRRGSLACEYELPQPPDGMELDFGFVNVTVVDDDTQASTTLQYVAEPGRCDESEIGWHYDVDPETGAIPMRIEVCPSTCERLMGGDGTQVEIQLGCETQGPR